MNKIPNETQMKLTFIEPNELNVGDVFLYPLSTETIYYRVLTKKEDVLVCEKLTIENISVKSFVFRVEDACPQK